MISKLGLGTLGFEKLTPEVESFTSLEVAFLVRRALFLGISLIDTAPVYGAGAVEEMLGLALLDCRESVFLATKILPGDGSALGVRRSLEGSLKRLRTDYVDLLQVHWPDPLIPWVETMGAMERLRDEGKVRHLGLCNVMPVEVLEVQQGLLPSLLFSVQNEVNLIVSSDYDVHQAGLTYIAYSPLAQGRLTARRAAGRNLSAIAERNGVTAAQMVLAWLVHYMHVLPIPKMSSARHLQEAADVLALRVPPDDYREISTTCIAHTDFISTSLIDAPDNGLKDRAASLLREGRAILFLKPVKVISMQETGRFRLVDGALRYWVWVLQYGNSRKSIPALVLD